MNNPFFCLHPNFSIQGRSFNEKDLGIYATSLLLSEKTLSGTSWDFFVRVVE
jgi:hypothetical protein